eukprot:529283-Amorphochlora_amoeboformis.AAC.1
MPTALDSLRSARKAVEKIYAPVQKVMHGLQKAVGRGQLVESRSGFERPYAMRPRQPSARV